MSDEDISIDDVSDDELNEEEQFVCEVEVDDSPEGIYQQAKGNVGFSNELAAKQFLEVMENEEAEMHLRAKASYNALPLLASADDLDVLQSTFDFFIDRVEDNEINTSHFERTMDSILINILHSERVARGFLNHASGKLDPNSEERQKIALDVKLRQIEIEIKYANYAFVDELIPDTAAYIPECPSPENKLLTRFAGRLLIIQIELALMRGNEDAVNELYDKISKLHDVPWNSRQTGVLRFVEGKRLMKEKNFARAKDAFTESFSKLNESGSDKRTEVLAYWTLTIMLVHKEEEADIFASGDINQFKYHPQVAPLFQLYEFYVKKDIVGFKAKLDEAKKIFHSELYNGFLKEVENYVLKNTLARICLKYTKVQLPYLAIRCMGKEEKEKYDSLDESEQEKVLLPLVEEIKNYVIELILSRKLDASIDLVDGIVVTHENKESLFLSSITPMINVMDTLSLNFLERTKIRVAPNAK